MLAVSVAAALLVAELGLRFLLRAAAGASLDTQARRSRPSRWPDVVYELRPGLRGLFHGQPLSTNSHGMRGPETPLAKPPGVYRIAGLGDSQMFGWGVADEEVYLRRLEVLLNERARAAGDPRRFETLNFAVPGYNAAMEVATFEHKALAFSPDLVVVHFVRNDLEAPHFAKPPRSYLLAVLRGALAGADRGEEGDAEPGTRRRRPRRRGDRWPFAHLGGPEAYARAMARLAELSRRRGIPVLVMTLERGKHPLMREAVRRHELRFVPAAPRFYAYLGERGLTQTRGAWAQTFRLGRDGHPNALSHRLFAEVLVEELEALGVIGPRGRVANVLKSP